MPSSAWSSGDAAPAARRGPSLGLKVALGVLSLPFLLWLFLTGQSKAVQARAWPVIRQVARQLQTDADAGRLYRANPALARGYPSEEVFLDRVRAYRAQFPDLPDRAPGADRYECFAGPNGFRASVQGSGGAWAAFEVRQSILFEKVPGEGLLRMEFSPTKEPNDSERRALRKARAELDWQQYREVCDLLASEPGTRALWLREPGLRRSFPDEAALQAFAADIRPHLQPLLETPGLSKVRLHRQVEHTPQGESVRLGHPLRVGTLTLAWFDGQLTGLAFTRS